MKSHIPFVLNFIVSIHQHYHHQYYHHQHLSSRDSSSETHAVCLRHPVLMRKSRSRRPSEYEIVEKSRSPHDDFSKKQRKLALIFFVFQK